MFDPRSELNDPSTSAQRLAEIAQQHPELGAEIAAHPNVYPELQAWIAQNAFGQAETGQVHQAAAEQAQDFQPTQPQPTQPQPTQPQDFQPTQPTFAHLPQTPVLASQVDPAVQQAPQLAHEGFSADAAPAAAPIAPQGYDPMNPGAAQFGAAQPEGAQYGGVEPPHFGGPGGPVAPGGPGKKKRKTGLFVTLGLVFLLAVGGGVSWVVISGKIGGSSSPEEAAKKLFSSSASMDELSLYGSLAPSEFRLFEPATKALSEAKMGDGSKKNFEQLFNELKNEIKVTVPTPIETKTEKIIEGEVERVNITEGVMKMDGDPKKVAQLLMEFYEPIILNQASSWGGKVTKKDLSRFQDGIETGLRNTLPSTIDFSKLDTSVIAVRESGSWYVSPLMSYADAFHKFSGNRDSLLGNKIVEPAKKGAKSAEQAAAQLTEAVFEGDYDAVVEQMPLAERRLLSVYGESFAEAMYIDLDDLVGIGATLDEAKYGAKTDGERARVDIKRLAFSYTSESWYDAQTDWFIDISGTCATYEGERTEEIDYYSDEYDYLWQRWKSDTSYKYDYESWLEDKGYEAYETGSYEDSGCLSDISMLEKLGAENWAIIALQEDGDWKISPLATFADMAFVAVGNLSKL